MQKLPGFIYISCDLIPHIVANLKLRKHEKGKKKINVKHMCSKPQRFCKHDAMIIASGRQVIPLPEFITGDCATMTTKSLTVAFWLLI